MRHPPRIEPRRTSHAKDTHLTHRTHTHRTHNAYTTHTHTHTHTHTRTEHKTALSGGVTSSSATHRKAWQPHMLSYAPVRGSGGQRRCIQAVVRTLGNVIPDFLVRGSIPSRRFCLYEPGHARVTCIFIYCLLYTSPSPRDRQKSRMPSSA